MILWFQQMVETDIVSRATQQHVCEKCVYIMCVSGPNKHQSAVTCLQFRGGLVLSSSDDGTVKLWDLRSGAWLRDVVALQSRGSGDLTHVFTTHNNTYTQHTWDDVDYNENIIIYLNQ